MLSVSFGSDPGYLTRHVEEHADAERGNYYLTAAEHGEPPGRWFGAGAEALGLTGDVDKTTMLTMYGDLVHPVTGEALGARPYQFKDTPERLAEAIAAEGGEVTPERQSEIELEVRKTHREARNYVDATFSAPKSWSVLHAGLESQGRHDEAQELWAAWMDGVEAGTAYLQKTAGYSRAGRHGAKVAGRTSGRWVEAPNWVMSTWRHHTSRDGDPQLHVHLAILNRVECDDGKWRSLDGQAILRARPAAGAIAERAAEESASRRLGVSFATRPDGKAREVVGVDEPIRDQFSARRRAITSEIAALATEYQLKHGRAPQAYVVWRMAQHATVQTRKAKPDHPPTRAELLAKWEAEANQVIRGGLARVADQAGVGNGREPVAMMFDPGFVINSAVWEVQTARASWTRHDLIASINRHLPDSLGGLSAEQITTLVEDLADEALSPGGEVIRLNAPELVAAPPELRFANGRSMYEPPEADRYASTWHLRTEESVLAAVRSLDGPKVEPEVAERLVSASRLSPTQGAAVVQLLTSGRVIEPLLAAAGTGKTFTMAQLAQAWTEATGTPALGLTTAERARQVLADEGFEDSANIARWLGIQERIATGKARPQDEQYRLVPGQLIVVDEASMVTTNDLDAIRERAQAVGAKVILTGDDHQLGAVGAGGMFRLIVEEVEPARLEEVRRFAHVWEREASARLRNGDVEVLLDYDRRGRILGGSRREMIESATREAVANRLRGDTSLLVVSTNELAAEIASEVRSELVRLGKVEAAGAMLGDGNRAGVGDMIMTRKNNPHIRTENGAPVVNREIYIVDRSASDGTLTAHNAETGEQITLPADYVGTYVELAYASTAHSAQGATVKVGAEIVDEATTREGLYVGASRGSERNTLYVVTHDDGDPRRPEERPDRFGVLAGVMEREDAEASATEVLREEMAGAESLARLEPIWADVVDEHVRPQIRDEVLAAVDEATGERLINDDSFDNITRLLREAEYAGLDRQQLITEVTAREFDSADSAAAVVSWRIQQHIDRHATGAPPVPKTYLERTPEGDDPKTTWARQLAEAMDRRVSELGEQAAIDRPGWAKSLGPVPDEADKVLEWSERAGAIGAYREAHGYQSEHDAIGPAPLARNVEARAAWERAYAALGRPEAQRDLAGASDAELHGRVDAYRREETWAPPHVDDQLREKSLSLDYWRDSIEIDQAQMSRETDAEPESREDLHNQRAAMYQLEADVAALEEISEARATWHEMTRETRDRATAASRELRTRHPESKTETPTPPTAGDEARVTGAAAEEERKVDPAVAEREAIEEGLAKARAVWERQDRQRTERERDDGTDRTEEQERSEVDLAIAKAQAGVEERRTAAEAERHHDQERLDYDHVQAEREEIQRRGYEPGGSESGGR